MIRPLTLVRCKRQAITQWYTLFWGSVDAVRYEGSFRVCYVPGVKIDSITYVRGDAAWTGGGLTSKSTTSVVFNWRGSAAPCLYARCVAP